MDTRISSMIQPAHLVANKNIINTILRRLLFFFSTFDLKAVTAVKLEYSWTWLAVEARVIFLLNTSCCMWVCNTSCGDAASRRVN